IDQGPRFAQLVDGAGNELLATETGVDAHEQDHVDLVHHVFQQVQRGRRVEHQARLAAAFLDQLQRTVDVLSRFRVESNVAGTGFDEVTNDAVHRANHQMHIDRRGNAVFAQCRTHHRADGQVRDVMVVHDIEVHDVCACGENRVDFLAQTGEVGGKNRRSNEKG